MPPQPDIDPAAATPLEWWSPAALATDAIGDCRAATPHWHTLREAYAVWPLGWAVTDHDGGVLLVFADPGTGDWTSHRDPPPGSYRVAVSLRAPT